MFGLITKKELKNYLDMLKATNRAASLGQVYVGKPSKEQHDKNIYLQGYEDGTDNMFNAVCSHFKL